MNVSDTETLELTPDQLALLHHELDFEFDPDDWEDRPFAFQLGHSVGNSWITCRSADGNLTGNIMLAYYRLASVVPFGCIPYNTMADLVMDLSHDVPSLLQEAGLNKATDSVSKYIDDPEFLSGFCNGIVDGELLS